MLTRAASSGGSALASPTGDSRASSSSPRPPTPIPMVSPRPWDVVAGFGKAPLLAGVDAGLAAPAVESQVDNSPKNTSPNDTSSSSSRDLQRPGSATGSTSTPKVQEGSDHPVLSNPTFPDDHNTNNSAETGTTPDTVAPKNEDDKPRLIQLGLSGTSGAVVPPGLMSLNNNNHNNHPKTSSPDQYYRASPPSLYQNNFAFDRAGSNNNYSVDDLSSLSTVISRDLIDDGASILEAPLLKKLEKQNKQKFQSRQWQYKIAIVGERGSGKTTLREKLMRSWVLMGERTVPAGTEYCYQLSASSSNFQVSILEAKPSSHLLKYIESRMQDYLLRLKASTFSTGLAPAMSSMNLAPDGSVDMIEDERLHLCLFLFPIAGGKGRTRTNSKINGSSDKTSSNNISHLKNLSPGTAKTELAKVLHNPLLKTAPLTPWAATQTAEADSPNAARAQKTDPPVHHSDSSDSVGGSGNGFTHSGTGNFRTDERDSDLVSESEGDFTHSGTGNFNNTILNNAGISLTALMGSHDESSMAASSTDHDSFLGSEGNTPIIIHHRDAVPPSEIQEQTPPRDWSSRRTKDEVDLSSLSAPEKHTQKTDLNNSHNDSDALRKNDSSGSETKSDAVQSENLSGSLFFEKKYFGSEAFSEKFGEFENPIVFLRKLGSLLAFVPIITKTDLCPAKSSVEVQRTLLRDHLQKNKVRVFRFLDEGSPRRTTIPEEDVGGDSPMAVPQEWTGSSKDPLLSNITPFRLVSAGGGPHSLASSEKGHAPLNVALDFPLTPCKANRESSEGGGIQRDLGGNTFFGQGDVNIENDESLQSLDADSIVGKPFCEPLPFGFVKQLRNQVLTPPLAVDCALNPEQQDTVYGLPRFDGHPPASPDFLRLVLIEGCSLQIKDHTFALFRDYCRIHERQRWKRKRIESAHSFLMNGLMVAAASAAFFLTHRK